MAGWEERFDDYVERLGDTLGHADRRGPLRAYTTGLLLPGERKSIEPMAARVDPARGGAAHQSLHHFVAKAAWDDAALLEAVRGYVRWVLSRSANPQPLRGLALRRRAWPGPTATSTWTNDAPCSASSRPAPRSARSPPGSAGIPRPSTASSAATASATGIAASAATSP